MSALQVPPGWALGETPDPGTDSYATPFESWCELHGLHPDRAGAWEQFRAWRELGRC